MNKPWILSALIVGLAVGFGAGYLFFYEDQPQWLTATLSHVDQIPVDTKRQLLEDLPCIQVTPDTIECKFL